MTSRLADIVRIYQGSDGEATRALYAEIEQLGPAGPIAVNLLRAAKTSERAKRYRGRGRRGAAYDTKGWSIDNLCKLLPGLAAICGIQRWGWSVDPDQARHRFVLYVDLPTGQVSFHGEQRGDGPDYTGTWDGRRGLQADRIVRWAAALLDNRTDYGDDGSAIAPAIPTARPRPATPQETFL